MIHKKIIDTINEALAELLSSFLNKDISEEELLKELNETVHYNQTFKQYIYEMFFIVALKQEKIPRSATLINMIFKTINTEEFLLFENYKQDGTRKRILKKLNVKEALALYTLFLIKNDSESHILLEGGVNNPLYIKAKNTEITPEDIQDVIKKEIELK